ncbi:MAG: HAD family hydrolase [Solobacterium sp.]|nr:HAD family hydrolase [Solobacterium sp.]
MSIKAVLFDFDDTLGNREEYTHRTYAMRMEELLKDEDPWRKEAAIQSCLIYDQHGDVPKRFVRERLTETMGIDLGENLEQYWREHQYLNVVLYPDAKPVLCELKRRGFRIGILSNGDSLCQRRKIDACGISDLLDVMVISGDTDTRKPDPEIFRLTAAKLGLTCEECVFVGDMFLNDVMGAHLAGMKPVWVWPHGTRYNEIGVPQISRLSELLDLIPQKPGEDLNL